MIIDSPIISGSSAASGSLNQFGNVSITGSLFVNGVVVTGNTGSAESASYAGAYTLTSSFQSYTASTDARIASINTTTASLNSYTASTDAKITSINAFSASVLNYTSSTDAKVNALYAFSSSLLSYTSSTDAKIASIYSTTSSLNDSVASLNTYTSSNTMNVVTLFAASASLNANVAGLNAQTASLLSYTSSNNTTNTTQNTRLSALEAATASIYTTTSSLNDSVASLNAQTASLLSYTSSNSANVATLFAASASLNSSVSTLFAASASLNANVAGLNSYTSSNSANVATLFAASASLNASAASLNSYTSSLNAKTASFATTGSNTLTGVQYVSNNSQATSFTSTASIYTDGGMRVTRDAYVSGTLYLNNLTVFGTQSVNFITSSQLNIATNIITVNTSTPTVRFGGLAVQDSGSGATGLTGSILWDSQDNQWIYSNPSGSAYDSAVFLVGPRSTGALGSEVGITTNALAKGDGLHHMTSSGIFESGSGNVGIGTSIPSYKLDVVGAIQSSVASGNGSVYFNNSSLSGKFWTAIPVTSGSETDLQWYYGGTGAGTKVTFANNGNIGIGTTTPSGTYGKLSVAGGVSILNDNNAKLEIGRYSSGASNSYIKLGTNSNSLRVTNNTDVADIFIIENGGNVGIGTTSPTHSLDVSGIIRSTTSSNISGLILRNTTAGSYSQMMFDGDNADAYIFKGNSTYSSYGGANSFNLYNEGPLAFHSSTTNNIMFMTAAGNVGIGTSSPLHKLHVNGNIVLGSGSYGYENAGSKYVGTSYVDLGTDGYSGLQIESVNAPSPYNGNYSQNLKFWAHHYNAGTGASPRMTIQYDGKIGIGTTAPLTLLDVKQTATGTATVNSAFRDSSSNGNALQIWNGNNEARFRAVYYGTASDQNITFYTITSAGSESERMRIQYDGNIGIGTTSPAAKLHVYSSDGTFATIQAGGGQYAYLRLQTPSSGDGYIIKNLSTGNSLLDKSLYLWNSNGPIQFVPSQTQANAVTIATSGNLGIGTSSPAYKLEVNTGGGTGDMFAVNGTSGNYIKMGGVASGNTYIFSYESNFKVGNDYSSGDFYLVAGNSDRVVIKSGGNVGIGTTSPATKFVTYLGAPSDTIGIFLDTDGTGGAAGIGVGSSVGPYIVGNTKPDGTVRGAYGGSRMFFNASGFSFDYSSTTSGARSWSTFMTINTGGNVGIGTTSPSQKLVVSGGDAIIRNAYIGIISDYGSNYASFSHASRAGAGQYSFLSGNAGETYVNSATGASIYFRVNNSDKMTLSSDGNVGIGTTSPNERLDVSGNISITTNMGSKIGFNTNDAFTTYGYSAAHYGVSYGFTANPLSLSGYFGVGIYTNGTQRMLIDSSGNVGVGTTSPVATFEVISSGRLAKIGTGIVLTSTNTAQAWMGSENWGWTGAAWSRTANSAAVIWGTGNNAGAFEVWTLSTGAASNTGPTDSTSRFMVSNGGNVGIGTTSPIYKLDTYYNSNSAGVMQVRNVSAGGAAHAGMYIGNDTTSNAAGMVLFGSGYSSSGQYRANGNYIYSNQNGGLTLHAEGANSLYLATNSNLRLLINSSGDIGIGTTSPNVTGFGGARVITVQASIQPILELIGSTYNSTGVFGGGAVHFRNTSASVGTVGVENLTGNQGNMVFYTNNGSTWAERMRIASDGNVGIGTTSPAYELDVVGGSITSRRAISAPRMSSAGEYTYGITNSPTWNTNNGGYTNNNATSPDSNTSAGTYTLSTTTWDLYQTISATSGVEYTIGVWVKLGTATNFCIVVNNTQNWNTVGGKAFNSSDGLSTSKWTHISFTFTGPSTGQINLHIGAHNETGVTQQTAGTVFLWNWEMTTASSTWVGRVDDEIRLPGSSIWTSRANVGIGTTNPGFRLHVANGDIAIGNGNQTSGDFSQAQSLHFLNEGVVPLATIKAVRTVWNTGDTDLTFSTYLSGMGERMRITSGGQVGINTTSPLNTAWGNNSNTKQLSIYGSSYAVINLEGASGGTARKFSMGVGDNNFYMAYDNTAATHRLVINSSGNVGINTTAASYTLDVNGTGRFGAVIVGSLGTGTVYSNGGTLTNTNPSDRRLKTNIIPLAYGLSDVLKLNPVSYNWKDGTNGKQFGFIAQDVQEVMPDAIKNGEYLGLEKDAIYASLVNAIKEQQQQIDELKYLLQTINK